MPESFKHSFSPNISLIMPILNGAHALTLTVDSILQQKYNGDIEFIAIDNNSQDESVKIIKNRLPNAKIIYNNKKGLATSYNKGTKVAQNEIIVLMHHDIILKDSDALTQIILPLEDKDTVASYPVLYLSEETYAKYDFWHKVMFSTIANRPGRFIPTLSGKFDAFKKDALAKIGFFDEDIFRVAGEDVDIRMKLERIGKIVESGVIVEHVHGINRRCPLKNLLKIEMRWGQTFGVLFRRYFISIIKNPFRHLGLISQLNKPMLTFLIFLSIFSPLLSILPVFAAIYYRWPAFKIKDIRVIFVPFLNLSFIFIYTFTFVHGLAVGRERI